MKKTKRILLFFSILLAILTTFLAQKVLYSLADQKNLANFIQVPVAKEDIPAMTKITKDSIKYIEIPKTLVNDFSIMLDSNSIINRTTIYPIKKNSPFLESQLIDDSMETPFVLEKNFRVITIPSSPLNTIGGNLSEGMYVDILWSHQVGDKVITSVAFQNVKVLAIGSNTIAGVSTGSDSQTISLKLSLKDAQKYYYMEKTGEIRIVLRPSQIVPSDLVKDYPLLNK